MRRHLGSGLRRPEPSVGPSASDTFHKTSPNARTPEPHLRRRKYSVSQPQASVEVHIQALSSPDAVARQKGRHELVRLGSSAVPAVVDLLKHPLQHVRWEACKTLEGIANSSAAGPLVEALGDSDKDVCWVAGAALIPLGREGLEALLVALLDKDRVMILQPGSHHVVHELAQGELKECVAPLLAALSGPEVELTVPVAAEKILQALRAS